MYETHFMKVASCTHSNIKCFYCNHTGHVIKFCSYKKNLFSLKWEWKPKASKLIPKANPIGLNSV